jgi:hypothetical protein
MGIIGVLYGSMGTSADALTTKAGFRKHPTLAQKGRPFIQLEANQLGETATFRLSQCSSIMKILFTPDYYAGS